MRWFSLFCTVGGLAGCIGDPTADAKVPGDALGTYQVKATLLDSSCGANALGSQESWTFSLRLSRRGTALYWLNGQEAITGSVVDKGGTSSFSFESRVDTQISAPHGTFRGCKVMRTDRASGTLTGTTSDVVGFTGKLDYAFAADAGSDCSDLLPEPSGLPVLPCEMEYQMTGQRTALPNP